MPSNRTMTARNIIEEIVSRRKEDIQKLGWDYGSTLPPKRERGAPVPFILERGVVLEVKRASPSKGDIAPNLNAADTACAYAMAGASAISVLTEQNYFKGSLEDLQAVCKAVDKWTMAHNGRRNIAVLRKDFIYAPEEIDVAYRAGADAVLLIARMLDEKLLEHMLCRCEELGMTAFVELRLDEDLHKLASVKGKIPETCRIVCGVNARDLKDFSIDLLKPASMLKEIRSILGENCSVIFESGIRTPDAASFAGSLGFTGMLLGEAAAKNPEAAGPLVNAFVTAQKSMAASKWLDFSEYLRERTSARAIDEDCPAGGSTIPLLKICGLTNEEDSLEAALAGADFLGFIFCKKSPRNTNAALVRQVKARLSKTKDEGERMPFLVGVVVDCTSEEAKEAIALVRAGILDFLQLHGEKALAGFLADASLASLPHYCAVNIENEADLDKLEQLRKRGEARILIDAKAGEQIGGTGIQIAGPLVQKAAASSRLWLAGGINPENVAQIIKDFAPELIDVSSGIEEKPGKKDTDRLLALCRAMA